MFVGLGQLDVAVFGRLAQEADLSVARSESERHEASFLVFSKGLLWLGIGVDHGDAFLAGGLSESNGERRSKFLAPFSRAYLSCWTPFGGLPQRD